MLKYQEPRCKNAELFTIPMTDSYTYRKSDSGPGARALTEARPGPDLTMKNSSLNAFSSYGCRPQVRNSIRMKADCSSPYISEKQTSLRRKRTKRILSSRLFQVSNEVKEKCSDKAGNLQSWQPKPNIMTLLLKSAHTSYNDTSEDERDRREFNMGHHDIVEAWKSLSNKDLGNNRVRTPFHKPETPQKPSKAAIKPTVNATSSPRRGDSTETTCEVKNTRPQDSATPQTNKSETLKNVQYDYPEERPRLTRPRYYRRNQKQKKEIQGSERSSELSAYELAYRKEIDRLDREAAFKDRHETFQRDSTCKRGQDSSFEYSAGGGEDGWVNRSQVGMSSSEFCIQDSLRKAWKRLSSIHEDMENLKGKRTSRASYSSKRDNQKRGGKGTTAKAKKSGKSEAFARAEQAKRKHTFGRDLTREQLFGRSNKPAAGAIKQAEVDKQRLVKKDKATSCSTLNRLRVCSSELCKCMRHRDGNPDSPQQKFLDDMWREGKTTGCGRKGEDCPAAKPAKGCDAPNTDSCFCKSREWDVCLDRLEVLQNLQKSNGPEDREISNKVNDLKIRLCWHICEQLQMQRKTRKTVEARY